MAGYNIGIKQFFSHSVIMSTYGLFIPWLISYRWLLHG